MYHPIHVIHIIQYKNMLRILLHLKGWINKKKLDIKKIWIYFCFSPFDFCLENNLSAPLRSFTVKENPIRLEVIEFLSCRQTDRQLILSNKYFSTIYLCIWVWGRNKRGRLASKITSLTSEITPLTTPPTRTFHLMIIIFAGSTG